MAKYTSPTIGKPTSADKDILAQALAGELSAGSAPSADLGKLKQLGSKLLGYAKENPGKTLGAATLGAGNLSGLLDNEYWGGQAIGGGLGAAAPLIINKLGGSISPYASAMISMGGGVLGSLFDKLRAKKAEEQAMAQQYGGSY